MLRSASLLCQSPPSCRILAPCRGSVVHFFRIEISSSPYVCGEESAAEREDGGSRYWLFGGICSEPTQVVWTVTRFPPNSLELYIAWSARLTKSFPEAD